MTMTTNGELTQVFSGKAVSCITQDEGLIWIKFEDGRVLSVSTADNIDTGLFVEIYQSQDIATIDNYGSSQEREAAGLC